jgi:hypothetical protein
MIDLSRNTGNFCRLRTHVALLPHILPCVIGNIGVELRMEKENVRPGLL